MTENGLRLYIQGIPSATLEKYYKDRLQRKLNDHIDGIFREVRENLINHLRVVQLEAEMSAGNLADQEIEKQVMRAIENSPLRSTDVDKESLQVVIDTTFGELWQDILNRGNYCTMADDLKIHREQSVKRIKLVIRNCFRLPFNEQSTEIWELSVTQMLSIDDLYQHFMKFTAENILSIKFGDDRYFEKSIGVLNSIGAAAKNIWYRKNIYKDKWKGCTVNSRNGAQIQGPSITKQILKAYEDVMQDNEEFLDNPDQNVVSNILRLFFYGTLRVLEGTGFWVRDNNRNKFHSTKTEITVNF